MSYDDFSREKNSRALLHGKSTGTGSRGPWAFRRRRIAHPASLVLFLIFCNGLLRSASSSAAPIQRQRALRADEEQPARITEAFERMRNAAAWPDEGVTADLDFHRCVAAASGNPYIGMVVGFLAGQMRQSIMFMRQNRFDPSGGYSKQQPWKRKFAARDFRQDAPGIAPQNRRTAY
jgi:hypothetical protein